MLLYRGGRLEWHFSSSPPHLPGATAREGHMAPVCVDGMTRKMGKLKAVSPGAVLGQRPSLCPSPVPAPHPLCETARSRKNWASWCQAKRMDLESSPEPDTWRQQPSDITRFNCPKISSWSKVVTAMIASERFRLASCQLHTTRSASSTRGTTFWNTASQASQWMLQFQLPC